MKCDERKEDTAKWFIKSLLSWFILHCVGITISRFYNNVIMLIVCAVLHIPLLVMDILHYTRSNSLKLVAILTILTNIGVATNIAAYYKCTCLLYYNPFYGACEAQVVSLSYWNFTNPNPYHFDVYYKVGLHFLTLIIVWVIFGSTDGANDGQYECIRPLCSSFCAMQSRLSCFCISFVFKFIVWLLMGCVVFAFVWFVCMDGYFYGASNAFWIFVTLKESLVLSVIFVDCILVYTCLLRLSAIESNIYVSKLVNNEVASLRVDSDIHQTKSSFDNYSIELDISENKFSLNESEQSRLYQIKY